MKDISNLKPGKTFSPLILPHRWLLWFLPLPYMWIRLFCRSINQPSRTGVLSVMSSSLNLLSTSLNFELCISPPISFTSIRNIGVKGASWKDQHCSSVNQRNIIWCTKATSGALMAGLWLTINQIHLWCSDYDYITLRSLYVPICQFPSNFCNHCFSHTWCF